MIVADFPRAGRKTFSFDERRVGKFRLVDVRTVFRNGEALGASAGEAADLSGKPEFDRVDDAALAGAVWAGNCERSLAEVDVELSDAADFLDVGGLKLDHFTSPPAGPANIFTRSSAFSFLPVESITRNRLSLSSSRGFR